jgi:chemotaxis protein CheD
MSVRSASDGGQHVVRIGELEVARAGAVLFSLGLGSCVALTLYDATARIGGLAHVMLPACADARAGVTPGRFASTAVGALIERIVESGGRADRITAKIAGGAAMFASVLPDGGRQLGRRNIAAVRAELVSAAIPLAGEDVGGEHGRSVFFHTSDGSLRVRSASLADVVL